MYNQNNDFVQCSIHYLGYGIRNLLARLPYCNVLFTIHSINETADDSTENCSGPNCDLRWVTESIHLFSKKVGQVNVNVVPKFSV